MPFSAPQTRPAGKAALLASSMLVTTLLLPNLAQAQQAQLTPMTIQDDAPKAVETTSAITAEEIDREQPKDLRQLFRDDPAVTTSGGSAAAQRFFVHGVEQSKLNVSIDGATQRSNIWHHNGAMTLDPMFLKSVDVSAGVSPADAGPGALGGTVQMKTKDAKDMLLPGQDAGGTVITSYNTNSESLRTTGAGYAVKDGFEVLGILTRNAGENYENGRGADEDGTKDALKSGLAKLAYESRDGHRISLSGEYDEDKAVRRMRPNLGLVTAGTGRLMNTTRATRTTVGVGYETTAPTATFDPKVNVYYNRVGLQRPNDTAQTAAASGVFNSNIETLGLKAQNTFAIPTGTLTAGFDVENTETYVRRYLMATDADEQVRNYGLFAQARIEPWTDWKISTGLRADYQTYHSVDEKDFDNAGLSPNVSAEYAITPAVSVFSGYSYVFGGMELPETGVLHARNYTVRDDVKPTWAHNFRSGLRYGADGLSLEGAVFRTLMTDTYSDTGAGGVRFTGPSLRTQGFDLSAGYDWSNAKLWSKYTYTRARYGGRMALPSDYFTAVPVGQMVTLGGEYTVEPIRLTVGGSTELTQGIRDEALRQNGFQPIKGYGVVDLFSEWQPLKSYEHWTLRLEANNIFDKTYLSRGTYPAATNVTPVYEEGRAFLLSTTVKF